MEVNAQTLQAILAVLLVTQGLKKLPWLARIIDNYTGGLFTPLLALVVSLLLKLTEIVADGKLTATESLEVLGVAIAAMGAHFGLKKLETEKVGNEPTTTKKHK